MSNPGDKQAEKPTKNWTANSTNQIQHPRHSITKQQKIINQSNKKQLQWADNMNQNPNLLIIANQELATQKKKHKTTQEESAVPHYLGRQRSS